MLSLQFVYLDRKYLNVLNQNNIVFIIFMLHSQLLLLVKYYSYQENRRHAVEVK